MLRGRIVAANGVTAEDLKPASRIGLGAARRPRHHLRGALPPGSRLVAGAMVARRLFRTAARLARDKTARRSQPQARRHHHRQCARPQHHRAHRQSARRRLAEPRHQFRPGVLARHVRRRAAHRHRDADLCRRRHARGGNGADQGAGRRVPGRHRGARQGRARRDRPSRRATGAGAARRERHHADRGRPGARRRACGRPAFPHLRRRCAQDIGATRGRLLAAYALEYLLVGLAAVLFGVAAGSVAADLMVTRVMEFRSSGSASPAAAAALTALLVDRAAGPRRHLRRAGPQARGGLEESL